MRFVSRPLVAVPALSMFLTVAYAQKEFLTPAEIEKIQDAQEIEKRIKIYLDASQLRLRAAEERLSGQEAAEGDPLEFFTVEDMLDGYFQILKSVMLNLDDAAQKKVIDQEKLTKALKNLKDTTEKATRQLDALKKMAEEKKLEKVWNLTNRAIDINKGAKEGAEIALASRPALPEKKKKK
jgi:DNA primase catalytic subunit